MDQRESQESQEIKDYRAPQASQASQALAAPLGLLEFQVPRENQASLDPLGSQV